MATPNLEVDPNFGDGLNPSQAINFAWSVALQQLSAGASEIVLPINSRDYLGLEGIQVVVQRFAAYIGATPSVFLDENAQAMRILAPPQGTNNEQNSESANENRAKKAKDRIAKVPRPPNAFILYRQFHHGQVLQENPGLHNTQISVIIGQMWKREDQSVKEIFKKQAETIKHQHEIDHPDYQYQPRKPSERKKRASKRKSEAITDTDSPSSSQTADASPWNYDFDYDANLIPNPFIGLEVAPEQSQTLEVSAENGLIFVDYVPGASAELQAFVQQHNDQPGLRSNIPSFDVARQLNTDVHFADQSAVLYEPINFHGTTPMDLAHEILRREKIAEQAQEANQAELGGKRQKLYPSLRGLNAGTKPFAQANAEIADNMRARQQLEAFIAAADEAAEEADNEATGNQDDEAIDAVFNALINADGEEEVTGY